MRKRSAWTSAVLAVAATGLTLTSASETEPVKYAESAAGTISGPARCLPGIREIDRHFEDFRRATWANDRKFARKAWQAMRSLQTGTEAECRSWVSAYYGYRSVLQYFDHARLPPPLPAGALVRLFNSERLQPLTRELREEWGGVWNRASTVLGAYACESAIVYFDPDLPPFDTGAVIAHEIDHLLRDKLTYLDELAPALLEDLPSALLLDETFASLHGGYLQLGYTRNSDFGRAAERFGDLSLFEKRGHLYGLWKDSSARARSNPHLHFESYLDRILFREFATPGSAVAEDWRGVLGVVSSAYFPDTALDVARTDAILRKWIEIAGVWLAPQGLMGHESGEYHLKRLDQRLERPTRACEIIRQGIEAGEAGTYIGRMLGDSGSEGGQPHGGGGVKPHGGGGVKPHGGGGVKPHGGGGVKPARPLAPCLKYSEKV